MASLDERFASLISDIAAAGLTGSNPHPPKDSSLQAQYAARHTFLQRRYDYHSGKVFPEDEWHRHFLFQKRQRRGVPNHILGLESSPGSSPSKPPPTLSPPELSPPQLDSRAPAPQVPTTGDTHCFSGADFGLVI